ncbi:23401_t:CDS:2, partial [Gigaspora rosea]
LYFANDFPLEVDIGKIEIKYCHCGAVVLPPLLPFPEELKSPFLQKHLLSQTFHQNICNYNSAVVFSSVVSNIKSISGYGQYMYKILEQVYHFLEPVQPNTEDIPIFGQFYFLNTTDAHEYQSNNP